VITVYLSFYTAVMIVISYLRVSKSYWFIFLAAAAAYPTASLSYLIYFAIADGHRLMNTINHTGYIGSFMLLVVVGPTLSFVWLLGALIGFLFLMFTRALNYLRWTSD
jgi:hypothetical protein